VLGRVATRLVARFLTLLWVAACSGSTPETGRLEIRVTEAATREPVPARLELLGSGGTVFVPPEALTLRFECVAAPLPDWAARYLSLSDRVWNRQSGTEQFYLDGPGTLDLPAGSYRLRVFKGLEYEVAERELVVGAGETLRAEIQMERWIDLPDEGWWSSDDHVHLTRRTPEEARSIAAWMRAEDLHVANLLQMGTVDQVGVNPQAAFGAAGEFRRGDTLVLAGQEHPRTHFLGHTITLGAERLIDERDTYIVYDTTFRPALEAGGLPGYAHWAIGPARDGIAIDAARGLVGFVEVLQFDFPAYDSWYELLDLGIRIAPTAGTDFPCGIRWGVPGRERFYFRLDAPPTRQSFLEAIRAGRTFVTNGPLLDLRVDGHGIGDEVLLAAPAELTLSGRVRFDPARDDPKRLELVVNGEPLSAPVLETAPGELRVETRVRFEESAWVALRVEGDKRGETPIEPTPTGLAVDLVNRVVDFHEVNRRLEAYFAGRGRVRPSAAHTAAVFVTVQAAPITDSARARTLARESMARLDDLEARLQDDRVDAQTVWDWVPYSDGVSAAHLRRNRPALVAAIASARQRYEAILSGPGSSR